MEEDRYIIFMYQQIYFLFVYEKDEPLFFHLIVPKIEQFDDSLLIKMIDFTQHYKIAKAIQVGDSIWLSFEYLFLNIVEGDFRIFKIAIKTLSGMFRDWRKDGDNMISSNQIAQYNSGNNG